MNRRYKRIVCQTARSQELNVMRIFFISPSQFLVLSGTRGNRAPGGEKKTSGRHEKANNQGKTNAHTSEEHKETQGRNVIHEGNDAKGKHRCIIKGDEVEVEQKGRTPRITQEVRKIESVETFSSRESLDTRCQKDTQTDSSSSSPKKTMVESTTLPHVRTQSAAAIARGKRSRTGGVKSDGQNGNHTGIRGTWAERGQRKTRLAKNSGRVWNMHVKQLHPYLGFFKDRG